MLSGAIIIIIIVINSPDRFIPIELSSPDSRGNEFDTSKRSTYSGLNTHAGRPAKLIIRMIFTSIGQKYESQRFADF